MAKKIGGNHIFRYLCAMKTQKRMTKIVRWLCMAAGFMLWAMSCQPHDTTHSAARPSVQARTILYNVEQRVGAHEAMPADDLLVAEIEFFDQHEMYDELKRALLLRAGLLSADGRSEDAASCLLQGLALAEALGDEAYSDQICQLLRTDVDSTFNASLARELLGTHYRLLSRHSFGDEGVSYLSILGTLLCVLTVGCLFFYKVRLDNELQREKIRRLREQMACRDASEIQGLNRLREAEVVNHFRDSLIHPAIISADDWSTLRKLFTDCYPSFEKRLRDVHSLSEVEWQVCMLLKLDFTPTDIASLTARSLAAVSTIRSRLYAKFFLQKGSSADWDRFIASL